MGFAMKHDKQKDVEFDLLYHAGLGLKEQKWIAAKIVSFLQAIPGQPAVDVPQRQLTWGEQITEDVNRYIRRSRS